MNHAAASTPQRLLRRLLVLLPAVLCSCISIPQSLKSSASLDGAHATEATGLAGLFLVRTASYLPGNSVATEKSFLKTACKSERSEAVLLTARSLTNMDATGMCSRLLAAADFVWRFSPRMAPARYQFEFYPGNQSVTRRALSIYPGAGHVLYAFHWTNGEDSLPEIVDTISHESLHLAASLVKLRADRRHAEEPAYLAGACAQLEVLGYIDVRQEKFAFDERDNVSASARRSGAAAASTWQSIKATAFDGRIRLDSPSGKAEQAKCITTLREFFKG